MIVTKKRHLCKALTWRLIASFSTFIMGWLITGKLSFGLSLGIADVVVKFVLYYIHERLWYKTKFGVIKDEQ